MGSSFPKEVLPNRTSPILQDDPAFGQWSSGGASMCLGVLAFESREWSPPATAGVLAQRDFWHKRLSNRKPLQGKICQFVCKKFPESPVAPGKLVVKISVPEYWAANWCLPPKQTGVEPAEIPFGLVAPRNVPPAKTPECSFPGKRGNKLSEKSEKRKVLQPPWR